MGDTKKTNVFFDSNRSIEERLDWLIANLTVLVNLFCNTLFDKYLLVTSLHWC